MGKWNKLELLILIGLILACIGLITFGCQQDKETQESLAHWDELQRQCNELEERIWKLYQLRRIDRTLYKECWGGPYPLWPLPLIEDHERRIKQLEQRN